jgi:hypothetical protein
MGDTQHNLFVLSIKLVGFHRGSFWHLSGSVVVHHPVESKMAHSYIANEWQVKWMSRACWGRRGGTYWCARHLRSLLVHVIHCTIGLKCVKNAHSCQSCWRFCCKFVLPPSLYFTNIFKFPVPLQNHLALLEWQLFRHHFLRLSCHAVKWLWQSCD